MDINRIIYKELATEISKPFISILIGPRQVGKTFLMRQLEEKCRLNGLKALYSGAGEIPAARIGRSRGDTEVPAEIP